MGGAKVIRGAYVLYVLLLIGSQAFLLAAPGRRIPIYAAIAFIGLLPAFAEDRRRRLWCVPAVAVCLGLIVYDFYAGQRFERRFTELRERISEHPAPAGPARVPGGKD